MQLQQCCVRASRSLFAACWCWRLNRAVTKTNRWSNTSRCCSTAAASAFCMWSQLHYKHFNWRGSHERGEQPFLLKRDCKRLKQLTREQTNFRKHTRQRAESNKHVRKEQIRRKKEKRQTVFSCVVRASAWSCFTSRSHLDTDVTSVEMIPPPLVILLQAVMCLDSYVAFGDLQFFFKRPQETMCQKVAQISDLTICLNTYTPP